MIKPRHEKSRACKKVETSEGAEVRTLAGHSGARTVGGGMRRGPDSLEISVVNDLTGERAAGGWSQDVCLP